MAEETSNPAPEATPVPDAPAPETELQKIEAEIEKVKAEIEAKAEIVASDVEAVPAKVAAVHAAIDQFGEDMRANVSPLIPTQAHNMLQGLKETLRAALVALF